MILSMAPAPAQAETIIGLTVNNSLVTFDSASPGSASAPVSVTGLQASSVLVGIDLRPSTGVLYGLGSNGELYTLSATTGAASFIGSLSMGSGFLGTASIDFNPVPDLAGNASLRITVAEMTQNNLRVNVNPGLVGTTVVDGDIGSPAGFFSGIAYTNNDRDPGTGTTLYGISRGFLYQVTDPNAGIHSLVGTLGVSGLTSDFFVGFDVSGFSGTAFASLQQTTGTGFYSINLATGAATLLGNINPAVVGNLLDITAAMQTPVVAAIPEPETYAMMMLGLAGIGWVARRRRR